MALIHTIQIANEKHSGSTVSSTRKSETRKYLACLVATTTEASLRIDAEKLAQTEKERAEWQAKLDELTAKLGMTVEQAEAQHKAESDRWYNREDGLFATKDRIRKERAAKGAGEWNHVSDDTVKADMLARGLVDPYNRNGAFGIHEAAQKVEWLTKTLADWNSPRLGSQAVLSWHGTVGLAQKALTSREATYAQSKGDTVAIRTDITITETKKRAKAQVEAE